MSEGQGTPLRYAIEYRICSLIDIGRTGNDQEPGRATTFYPAWVQSQGLEGNIILYTNESDSHPNSDDWRAGLVGPIGACLGPLQECSFLSFRDTWKVLLRHLCHERTLAYTGRCHHMAEWQTVFRRLHQTDYYFPDCLSLCVWPNDVAQGEPGLCGLPDYTRHV